MQFLENKLCCIFSKLTLEKNKNKAQSKEKAITQLCYGFLLLNLFKIINH